MNKYISLILFLLSVTAYAEDGNNPIPLLGLEPGVNKNVTYQMGLDGIENINVYSGTLSLTYKDIVIPGNGGFDIVIYRTYNSIQQILGIVGQNYLGDISANGTGWDIHMGRVLQFDYLTDNGIPGSQSSGCNFPRDTTMRNPVLELPDGRKEVLYNAADEYAPHTFVTKSFWVADCRPDGGLDVYSPNGYKYEMTHRGRVKAGGEKNALSVSRIEDRNGNYLNVSYLYQSAQGRSVVSEIISSDGRNVIFTYNNNNMLESISSDVGLWTYSYEIVPDNYHYPNYFLTKAVGPGGNLIWSYDYKRTGVWGSAAGLYSLSKIVMPYGATVDYTYAGIELAIPAADREAMHLPYSAYGSSKVTSAIKTRKLSGPEIKSTTHTYYYYSNAGFPFSSYSGSDAFYNYTKIAKSEGVSEIYKICGRRSLDYIGDSVSDPVVIVHNGHTHTLSALSLCDAEIGSTVGKKIYSSVDGLIESTDYNYTFKRISVQDEIRPDLGGAMNVGVTTYAISHQSITRGVTHYNIASRLQDKYLNPTYYLEYDGAPYPEGVDRLPPGVAWRQKETTYNEYADKWIIHEPVSEKWQDYPDSSDVIRDLDVFREYYLNGNVKSIKRFKALTQFTYYATGDLASVTDPLGKIVTYDGDYFRGIPKREVRQSSDGNIVLSKTVNNDGTVASSTNGRGFKTSYDYDGLGRVRLITPHGASNPLTVSYSFYGRTIQKQRGNYIQITHLDGLGRVIRESRGGVETTYDYDVFGRLSFRSYPDSISGVQYKYDDLGRLLSETETVDGAEIKYEYLEGNKVKITDARSKVTFNTYRAMGSPDNKELIKTEQYNDDGTILVTEIDRTNRGDVLHIKQYTDDNDPATTDISQDRDYYYDENYYQDGFYYPESGRNIIPRNSIGNIVSSQVDTDSISPSGTINYYYDDLHRLTLIDYPDATPDTEYTYDSNNNIKSVSHDSTVWNYDYDENDNLKSETLTINGTDYRLLYNYNANDVLDRITYPDGLFIDLEPNNLGRPTQAGVFASNILYYPNGQISSLTYGNGQTLSIGQNNRFFTDSIQSGGVSGVDLAYEYDAVGNVQSVSDHVNPGYDLGLEYDALNRLVVANGQWGMGSVKYDTAGNVKKYQLGANTLNYEYELNGARLKNTTGSKSQTFEYDVYGNISSSIAVSPAMELYGYELTYNDAGHLRAVRGVGTLSGQDSDYVYDGNGMRVMESDSAASVSSRISVYGKSGQLIYEKDGTSWKDYIRVGSFLVAESRVVPADVPPEGCPVLATVDSDGDLIPDCDELIMWLNPYDINDAGFDPDHDGLTNLEEYQHGLAIMGYNGLNGIYISDFDQDDIPDGYEVDNNLNPLLANALDDDNDGDTLTDLQEYNLHTRADLPDTDGDDVRDDYEVANGMNPILPDSDADSMPDGYEVTESLNPLIDDSLTDKDLDGFSNFDEFNYSTSAADPESYPNGKLRWSFEADGDITSAPTIDGDRIYLTTTAGTVYALQNNALDGVTVLWTLNLGQSFEQGRSPVIGSDGSLYIVGRYTDGRLPDNYLNAINRKGKMKWRIGRTAKFQSNPAIGIDGTIYIGSSDNYLHAISPSGTEKWKYAFNSDHSGFALISSPSIGNEGQIYVVVDNDVGIGGKGVFTLKDNGDSAVVLAARTNAAITSVNNNYLATLDVSVRQPVISTNGSVYYVERSAPYLLIASLNKDGTYRNRDDQATNNDGFVLRAASGYDDIIAGYTYGDGFKVLYGTTYTFSWVYDKTGLTNKAAVGNNGFIYAIDNGGLSEIEGLPTISPAEIHAPDWPFVPTAIPVNTTFPIIAANGDVYYGGDNVLYAVSSYARPENSSWPMIGQNYHHTSNICSLTSVDTDGDQIPDCYEDQLGLNKAIPEDALEDLDGDGLINRDEVLHSSSINDTDSDDDGLDDKYEIDHGLSAINSDSDNDGMSDGFEVTHLLNPLLDDSALDPDYDGYSNLQEYLAGTSPTSTAEYSDMPGTIKWKKKLSDLGQTGLEDFTIDNRNRLYSVDSDYWQAGTSTITGHFYYLGSDVDDEQQMTITTSVDYFNRPAIHDKNGSAYIVDSHRIFAINTSAATPTLKWSSAYVLPNTESIYDGSNMVLGNGYLYYITDAGYLRRISTNKTGASGVLLPGNLVDISLVIAPNGRVYVSGWDYNPDTEEYIGKVYCYSSALGFIGTIDNEIADLNSIVFMNNTMLIAGADGNIHAFDSNNNPLWSTGITLPAETYIMDSPIVGPNDKIYVVYNDGIREIDATTHLETWFYPLDYPWGQGSVVASDGTLYVIVSISGGASYQLIAFNPDKSIKWQQAFDTSLRSLRIGSDGTVYVLTANDELVAINDDTNGYALAPWPMKAHDPSRSYNAAFTTSNVAVSITSPIVTSYIPGTAVNFEATVTNAGTNTLHWYSSLSGSLGTGLTLTVPLTAGVHVIKAQLEDANGVLQAMDNVTVDMFTALPELTVSLPVDYSTVINTIPVTLTATATHATQGDISGAIQWRSDIDGALGAGGNVLASMSVGSHTITAQVWDAIGHSTSLTRHITVTSANDTDADGMADLWEMGMFGSLSRNGSGDFDGDGILDLAEYQTYISLPRDGDANNNGEVNVGDQLLLMRHVNGLTVLTDAQKARVDLYPANAPDGQLTIQDLLLLQRRILGLY